MDGFIPGLVNTLRPRQHGCHFTDDIFKCIFLNENVWILIKISLKFVPKGRINNIPALVQIMAWRRPGDKPLSKPMMVSLPMHICVTRPQWVNNMFELLLSLAPTKITCHVRWVTLWNICTLWHHILLHIYSQMCCMWPLITTGYVNLLSGTQGAYVLQVTQ